MLLVVADAVAVAQSHSVPSDPSQPSLGLKGTGPSLISSINTDISLESISLHNDVDY